MSLKQRFWCSTGQADTLNRSSYLMVMKLNVFFQYKYSPFGQPKTGLKN